MIIVYDGHVIVEVDLGVILPFEHGFLVKEGESLGLEKLCDFAAISEKYGRGNFFSDTGDKVNNHILTELTDEQKVIAKDLKRTAKLLNVNVQKEIVDYRKYRFELQTTELMSNGTQIAFIRLLGRGNEEKEQFIELSLFSKILMDSFRPVKAGYFLEPQL
jgi:hypothetical protein